jgi:hypothetical protein
MGMEEKVRCGVVRKKIRWARGKRVRWRRRRNGELIPRGFGSVSLQAMVMRLGERNK